MFIGIICVLIGLVILMILERIFPDRELKTVTGWWQSVILINILQLTIILIGMVTWERWFQIKNISLINFGQYMGPILGGFVAYIINTWIFYWWHRLRHENYFFWILCHQLHHSPQRIETITSFYKHPLEILINSILITILLYPILGLKIESSAWFSMFSAFGEFFYHMNIKTWKWMGYIFQRPESHRFHHSRNKRITCPNYSDLPIWDILGGTFVNPELANIETGYTHENEARRLEMYLFKDVLDNKTITLKNSGYTIILIILLGIGCLHSMGYLFNSTTMRGIAFSTAASPLPLVFSSYNGIETFSTKFMFEIEIINNTIITIPMTKKIYDKIGGPYNRRNVYGAIFTHGPFFQSEKLITLRQQILDYAICKRNLDLIDHQIKKLTVRITSDTKGNDNKHWIMEIIC